MSEEEKKAYNFYKKCNECDLDGFEYFSEESKKQIKYMETLLNLIEKQNNRLEQLEKENKPLEYNNATLEKQVKLMRDNFKIAVEQEVKENYIPKSVIRAKIEEIRKTHSPEDDYACSQIHILKKLLGEKDENRNKI